MWIDAESTPLNLTFSGQVLILAPTGFIENGAMQFSTVALYLGDAFTPVSNVFVHISGSMSSLSPRVIAVNGQDNDIMIAPGGLVITRTNSSATNGGAIAFEKGGNRLENDGTIYAQANAGVTHLAIQGAENTVINRGLIVSAEFAGIFADSFPMAGLILQNSGTIRGATASLSLSEGADRVTNSGQLFGDVLLKGGDDLLDSRAGRIKGLIDGGAGNDTIRATAGEDILRGGLGTDLLTGGSGADVFLFEAASSGMTRATRDRITDFQNGMDDIDLSAIDARPGGADDGFVFIGAKAFTKAGQLRVIAQGAERWVELNLDADKAAEMRIVLNGKGSLNASDFIL
jgi:Ca2+-binding RTX toxin-like protein